MSKSLYQGSVALGLPPGYHASDRREESPISATFILQQIPVWISRYRQRKALAALAAMNNYLLRDIGVSPEDALRESGKPFWQR
jgi:uncharacterized protein YjiS (DUF1127 family)